MLTTPPASPRTPFEIIQNGPPTCSTSPTAQPPGRFEIAQAHARRCARACVAGTASTKSSTASPTRSTAAPRHTLDGTLHPSWTLNARPRTGDLVVTVPAPGDGLHRSDQHQPPGGHGGPYTTDNMFSITGGWPGLRTQRHHSQASGSRGSTIRLRQSRPGRERRCRTNGAGAARPLRAARQRGAGADGGLRARVRSRRRAADRRAAGGGARCAGAEPALGARAPGGPRAADRLPAHRLGARRRRRVPAVARAVDPRQPARGPLPRALALLRVEGARRRPRDLRRAAAGRGRRAAAGGPARRRRDSRRCRRTSGRAAATRCGCSSSSGRCSGAATTAPWTSRSGCAARRSCRRRWSAADGSCAAYPARTARAGTIHRLRLASKRLARGAYTVRIRILGRQPHADRAARPAAPVATIARRGVPAGRPRRNGRLPGVAPVRSIWHGALTRARRGTAGAAP